MIRSLKRSQRNRGFTLIELLVCITIFVIMTALLLFKYGNFNQSVLLTNLVYDTALQIRTAQNYGLSVKTADIVGGGGSLNCGDVSNPTNGQFLCSYGVEFDLSVASSNPLQFFLFAHKPSATSNQYDTANGDVKINTYTLKRGATISGVCAGSGPGTSCVDTSSKLDIFFTRPDPSANICINGSCNQAYARITIKGTDNSTRSISVRSNGQISVDI